MKTDIYNGVLDELIVSRPTHKYKLGDLVELESGSIVYITRLTFDCDKVPLYGFSIEPIIHWIGGRISKADCGYPEDYIKRLVGHKDAILGFCVDTHYYECLLKDVFPLLKQNDCGITAQIDCTEEKLIELDVS